MKSPLVVKEYDTIVSNESLSSKQGYVYLEERYFEELEQFIKEYVTQSDEADILEFMQIGYKRGIGDTVTFKSYVGMIELPSGFQIEILPKASLGQDDNNARTKKIFLKMLNCLKDFDGKVFSSASLNVDKMNLYEIFIRMYIKETWALVRRGIKSDYISNEDNLLVYKGKLNVSKQITRNAAHKERFYMVFDEYQVNRPENKLIKSTLLKLLGISRNTDNTREIKQLLYSFELVQESDNYEKDFSKVSLTRGMRDYELLFVLDPTLDEETKANIVETVKTVINAGGEAGEADVWGERRLAYSINKKNTGYYVVLPFKADAELPKELDRRLRINENVMRHIIVCQDEE